ncbi:MAG: hypothetical protein LBF78_10570 [Treponema sp.]|jgi:hypothetical protein|nr:hypothetical protein [Treponema sp.]
MAKNRDWLPSKREDQLEMAKVWLTVLQTQAAAWGVPEAETAALLSLTTAADNILMLAKGSGRTPVITAQCRDTFAALTEKMRFIKNRYFLTPPLTHADYAALLLNQPDTTYSPRGTPRAQMTAEIGRSGTAMLFLKLVYAEGTEDLADDHTDMEYQIRWAKYSPLHPASNPASGEVAAVPALPEELPVVFTTKRKRELITFENGDSGKTAYFAIRIGNGNKEYGPWCPLFSSIIP